MSVFLAGTSSQHALWIMWVHVHPSIRYWDISLSSKVLAQQTDQRMDWYHCFQSRAANVVKNFGLWGLPSLPSTSTEAWFQCNTQWSCSDGNMISSCFQWRLILVVCKVCCCWITKWSINKKKEAWLLTAHVWRYFLFWLPIVWQYNHVDSSQAISGCYLHKICII